MRLVRTFLFLVFSIIGHVQYCNVNANDENEHVYNNHWVAEIDGGLDHAKRVAEEHGFEIESQLVSLEDHYHLKRRDVPHRSKRSADHHTKRLSDDSRIRFVEQQHEKRRVKRGHEIYSRAIADRIARSTGELNDPQYGQQWYLDERNDTGIPMDMGVRGAWKLGVTGRGCKVTILDDGLEKDHPDLEENYDASCSYDFNDRDGDPQPRLDKTNENKHGTRCGGEIAMVANNGKCGVGVAFNAKIGGLRMLDGKVTDGLEGDALGFVVNADISSSSWGPNDDGKTLEGPGPLAAKGIHRSITKGRGGKGSILVWAAGNGAMFGDNCNCDGYTSDHRTLSVSSVSESGTSPWYSEKCASTLTSTYSSGEAGDRKVVSTDLRHLCTNGHSGTSAAAPMAAGILALVLEKNPNLTWRDVQHLVVLTSRPQPLKKASGWYVNGAGFCVSLSFGFGLIDAHGLVHKATDWQTVPEQKTCRVTVTPDKFPKNFTSGNQVEVEIQTDGCKGQENEVNFLEHIKLILNLNTTKRGNIYAEIESPSGTITPLMLERKFDASKVGFKNWPLNSAHTWGEDPSGIWKFRVADRQSDASEEHELLGVTLELLGTREMPEQYKKLDQGKCDVTDRSPTGFENGWDSFVFERPRYGDPYLRSVLTYSALALSNH